MLGVGVSVGVAVFVAVGELVAVGDGLGDGVAVVVTVAVGEGVCVAVPVAVDVPVGVGVHVLPSSHGLPSDTDDTLCALAGVCMENAVKKTRRPARIHTLAIIRLIEILLVFPAYPVLKRKRPCSKNVSQASCFFVISRRSREI